MNTRILNRDFQHPTDGWYQIESLGNHPNRAAGVVQIVDAEAATSIVNRFNSDALAGKLRHGGEMLIDHEHFSDNPDKESRAYGWLQELQNRADGIYGRIRWTTTGQAAVDGGDYRFFSTEYAPQDLKVVNDGKIKQVRPLRLDGLSLTNMNNNRGQKPITNRAGAKFCPDCGAAMRMQADGKCKCGDCGKIFNKDFAGAGARADSKQQPQPIGQKMKTVCTLLDLSADASEEAVHAAVSKLKNRIVALEPHETENTTLKNRIKESETDACASLLDACGLKNDDKRRERIMPVLVGLKNRAERLAYLADFSIKPVEAVKTTQAKLHNRDTKPPGGKVEAAEGDEAGEKNLAVKIRNRANELRAGKNIPFDVAWNQAKQELTQPVE
jgi:hypothetical protein